MWVRFPGATRDFSPRVNFQCRSSGIHTYSPHVQKRASTSVRTLQIPNTGCCIIVWTCRNIAHAGRNGQCCFCVCCSLTWVRWHRFPCKGQWHTTPPPPHWISPPPPPPNQQQQNTWKITSFRCAVAAYFALVLGHWCTTPPPSPAPPPPPPQLKIIIPTTTKNMENNKLSLCLLCSSFGLTHLVVVHHPVGEA